MKHWKLVWTVAAVMALSAGTASQTPSGHAVFEQALAKERVDGNLAEAIRLYERVVAEFASDRALAAQALVQVGRCYEKLGRDDAVRTYERLVRDFADQEDAVEQARVRLAVLKRPAPSAAAAATMPGVRAFPRVDDTNAVLSLSPDGTKAAFGTYGKGQNLNIYDVATQHTTPLTDFDWTLSSAWVDHAAWSPDGRRIAYMQCDNRFLACGLRVATLAGESSEIFRNEAALVIPAGWLPDDRALVVMLGRADRTFSIGLVPTAGGPFTQLRSISSWPGLYPESPSVSPDGRWIAFSEGSQGMRDVHVISRDGQTARRITDHPADDHRPMWSPDGRHLAFLSNRNGSAALWTVAIRDGQPAAEPGRFRDGMQDVRLISWTTRGLAYSEHVRTDDIYTVPVDPASGEPVGSLRQIPYLRTGRNVAPGWSPDGKYLAFVSSSRAEPDRRAVVLLPSGGGEAREFPIPTSNYRYAQEPYDLRWFGNSSGLGFSGIDAKGESTLFRLTLATSEWRTFPLSVKRGTRIDWNSDGNRYFYAAQLDADGDTTIVERDLHSDRERVVYRRSCRVDSEGKWTSGLGCMLIRGLRFSPDRRLLAIEGNNIREQGILVLDLETEQTRVVYSEPVEGTLGRGVPTWSPDGRALLVDWTPNRGTDKQATALRRISIDGSEVRSVPLGAELTRLLSAGRGAPKPTIGSLVWSPDGGRLAFVLTASRLETWVLENPLALAAAPDPGARK